MRLWLTAILLLLGGEGRDEGERSLFPQGTRILRPATVWFKGAMREKFSGRSLLRERSGVRAGEPLTDSSNGSMGEGYLPAFIVIGIIGERLAAGGKWFWRGCKPNSVCPGLRQGRESFVLAADTRNPRRFRATGSEPLQNSLFGLAPDGVFRAALLALRAVRSYRTFSPLPWGLRPKAV